jgi:hypothetical protein
MISILDLEFNRGIDASIQRIKDMRYNITAMSLDYDDSIFSSILNRRLECYDMMIKELERVKINEK